MKAPVGDEAAASPEDILLHPGQGGDLAGGVLHVKVITAGLQRGAGHLRRAACRAGSDRHQIHPREGPSQALFIGRIQANARRALVAALPVERQRHAQRLFRPAAGQHQAGVAVAQQQAGEHLAGVAVSPQNQDGLRAHGRPPSSPA